MIFDITPLLLTAQLALCTVVILFCIALPIVLWLYKSNSPLRFIAQAMFSLPLVLPPVVVGFYLLLLFSPSNIVGRCIEQWFHTRLVFTFGGLVVGSVLFNLPFMINPLLSGLESLPKSIAEASYILGKGVWQTFFSIQLPAMRPAIATALVLTFAHTVGEFGVVLMMGGNIPGVTRVASIAIYNEVEAMNYGVAHIYSAVLVAASFIVLFVLIATNKKFGTQNGF